MEDPELLTLLAAEAERRGPMIITGIEELATSGEKNPARIEELRVEDRADVMLTDPARKFRGQRRQVERDDRPVGMGGQRLDQPVADLTAGTRDQDDRFAGHGKRVLWWVWLPLPPKRGERE